MANGTLGTEAERVAIPAGDVAALLGISERHLWGLNSRGQLPKPVRLGRAVRWLRSELVAWINAGAPCRERWEDMKGGVSCA